MTDPAGEAFAVPLSLPCEHGLLHGRLLQVANATGLVVLVHGSAAADGGDEVLAARFREAGLSSLSVDLLARQEAHFADVHNNVPLLAKRLLDFLGLIRKCMLVGELAPQPLGLWAANATSPVAVRVAALRDHDVAAVVCRDGLIDLAGMLYLRALAAPLLMLMDESDARRVTSNRRALQEVRAAQEIRLTGAGGSEGAALVAFESTTYMAADWFVKHFAAATPARLRQNAE
jgi:hypothetical protein